MSFRLYVCHAIPFPIDGDVEILCKNNKKYQEKQKIGGLFYHPPIIKKRLPSFGGKPFLVRVFRAA
jgi:hypothetical protein